MDEIIIYGGAIIACLIWVGVASHKPGVRVCNITPPNKPPKQDYSSVIKVNPAQYEPPEVPPKQTLKDITVNVALKDTKQFNGLIDIIKGIVTDERVPLDLKENINNKLDELMKE
jgi:hypothetical protein